MTDAERTALGDPDPVAVRDFWVRFVAETSTGAGIAIPEAWAFGDSVQLADKLISLVLRGPKRATAGLLADYEAAGEAVPEPGMFEIVTDGSMHPRAVLEITDVRIGPLSTVDDQFAYDEGEGDRSRSYWLDAHTRAFRRSCVRLGIDFDPHITTVFERFDVVYTEDDSPGQ